jgi:hypothetical protein
MECHSKGQTVVKMPALQNSDTLLKQQKPTTSMSDTKALSPAE